MNVLKRDTVEGSELVEQTFEFWFTDNAYIRSPFPNYIRQELKNTSVDLFYQWANNLNEKAKEELNDEIIAEKFEEIIFEVASTLVMTEDEKLTILYPFMPRMGDQFKNEEEKEGKIIDRYIGKEGDHSFFWVKCVLEDGSKEWKTSFELPV